MTTPRLARITLILTLFLIGFGGFTRGSSSGYGCEDRWPLCQDGLLGGWLPRPEFHMVVEWTHRWIAAWVGLLALLLVVSAWRGRASGRTPFVLASAALGVVMFQAWIGRAIVKSDLAADLVSLHLLISLTVAFLITAVFVTSSPEHDRPGSPRWRLAVGLTAISSVAVLFLGTLVHNQYHPGWPIMNVGLFPDAWSTQSVIHWFHRLAAGLVLVAVLALARSATRSGRPPASRRVVVATAWLYSANILAGWLHVLTEVRSSAVVATHLTIAAVVSTLLVTEYLRSLGTPATIQTGDLSRHRDVGPAPPEASPEPQSS